MNIRISPLPVGAELMDFDPFGAEFRADPSPFHPLLFAASPGFVLMEGVPSAFVATYGQTAAVLRDFKRFSSQKPKGMPGMQRIDFFNGLPVMNYSDPPHHTRRRRVVNPAFTPKRTQQLNELASTLIDELLDDAIAQGSFDAVNDITKPLAIDVLLRRFLGIADEDQHIFLNYVMTLPLLDKLKLNDPKPQTYLDAWEKGKEFCRRQQELAKRGECDNLIGLIAGGAEGGAIDEDEMMAMMVVLLTGGVSTVAGAAASSLLNLAQNPAIAERIRQDPALAISHLEESLRLDPPVSLVMRFAAEDVELDGTTIPQGMPVYAMIAVACHDPVTFPNPYKFDIDRPNAKDHLAFGYGIHTCIGNAITRNIVPLLIRKVADRMPNLRPAEREDFLEWDVGTPRSRHIRKLVLTA